MLRRNPVILRTNPVMIITSPVTNRSNPVIFRTHPILFRTTLVIIRTNLVTFRTNPVIFSTNPIIFRRGCSRITILRQFIVFSSHNFCFETLWIIGELNCFGFVNSLIPLKFFDKDHNCSVGCGHTCVVTY